MPDFFAGLCSDQVVPFQRWATGRSAPETVLFPTEVHRFALGSQLMSYRFLSLAPEGFGVVCIPQEAGVVNV